MIEPVRRSASWTRGGTPEDALSAIEEYGITHLARVRRNDSLITLIFGSRLAQRLLGASTDRIPYTIRVTVTPGQGTGPGLAAEAYSDAGSALYRTEYGTHLYEQLLDHTLSELQQL